MLSGSRLVVALVAATAYTSGVAGIAKISRKGRYLYDDSGSRFYIKGIAYQPEGNVVTGAHNLYNEPSNFIDPLSNSTGCARDLPYLKQLGVNTIRVYSVNSSENHDACMKSLSDAGIYAMIDLSLPDQSITRDSPAWSTNLLDTYLRTIDAFSGYDNILGYNVGNEIVNQSSITSATPFIKAAARDVKAYLKSKSSSALVGYSSIDGKSDYRDPTANFLSCGAEEDAIDMYGLNNYEWCNGAKFSDAYQGTTGDFAGYNVVAYFSEFGNICDQAVRQWTEVPVIYSSQMSDVWSGGVAFSYFPRTSANNQFGMVTISSDGSSISGTSDDFKNLASAYGQASGPNSPGQSSAVDSTYPTCPQQNSTFLASSTLPPTPNDSACSCLQSSLSCVFTPSSNNVTEVGTTIGNLIGSVCSALGSSGGNCNDIASSGSTGTYGIVSQCDAASKLSYIMSQYYEGPGKRATDACSWGGSGTVKKASATATSVASSCLASATGASTPSAPASSTSKGSSTRAPGSSQSSGSNSGGDAGSSAISLHLSSGLLGVFAMVVMSVAGGMMTLA